MRASVLALLLCLAPPVVLAQGPVPPAGRPYLFVLDLQGTALDEFPSAAKALGGVMTVVDVGGQHVLKASSPSDFLIPLPQALPADFTIELEVIPTACCAADVLMLEGTPTRNRGVASAELTWHPSRVSAVGGGGDMYQADMPADLAASTPGVLTRVVVVVQGPTIRLYTNGRRLYTLDKQFARGRVLRVGLGGGGDGANAAYLAGLRIGMGATPPTVVAGGTGNPGGGIPGGGTAGGGTAGGTGGGTGGRPGPPSPSQPPGPTGSTSYVPPPPSGGGTGGNPGGSSFVPPPPTGTGGSPGSGSGVSPFVPPPPTGSNPSGGSGTGGSFVPPPPTGTNTGGSTTGSFVPPPPTGTNTSGGTSGSLVPPPPTSGTTAQSQQALSGPTPTTMTMAPRVTQGSAGPVVQWTAIGGVSGYTVRRWKSDDATCCNNASGSQQAVSPWQDAALLNTGTYIYEVEASLITGGVMAERAQFTVMTPVSSSTPTSSPPSTAPPSPTAISTPSPGTTGTATPIPMPTPTVTPPLAAQPGATVPTASAPRPGTGAAAALTPTGPPPNNIAVTGTPSLAMLNWGSISGLRGVTYQVDRWLESNPACCTARSSVLTFPAWTDEGLQWPGVYVFRITAFYPDGSWGQATQRYMRPDPVNPANFRAAAVSAGSVSLVWDAVPNASWYELSGPGLGLPNFQATGTSYNVRNLAPGTYTWRVGTFYSSPNAPGPVSGPSSAFPSVTVIVP